MVTRDDQLKWLAENSDSFSGEYAVMSMNHHGLVLEQGDTLPHKPPFGLYFFTRQEWMNEEDLMQKIATSDNSWHERGELPPVGCVCEVDYRGEWIVTAVIGVDSRGYCVFEVPTLVVGGPCYDGLMAVDKFRPLRTERDKAIEEMANLISKSVFGSAKCQAEKLYDAGYRKQE